MFKIYTGKRRNNMPVAADGAVLYSQKHHSLYFTTDAIRCIGDPPSVYLEYDEDGGAIRLRSALMCEQEGQRSVLHCGKSNTPRCIISCAAMNEWLNKHSPHKVVANGRYLIEGVADPEHHAIVFDLHRAQVA